MKQLIAKFFNIPKENIFLFSKGRVGLYAILKALGLSSGDEIIVPGYTCMVVPSAASFLGVTCKYADIDPLSYNINPAELDRHITARTKALIIQHTYGIPADMGPIMQWARKNKVLVVEDCCHAFGSTYRGRLCGTFGSGAFFSGQWNKPFSTGLGGMLLLNDSTLVPELQGLYSAAATVSRFANLRLKAQIFAYNMFVTPRTNALITNMYRFFYRLGIAAGSSTNEELAGEMPSGYLSKMSMAQIQEGDKNLSRIDENIAARQKNVTLYNRLLQETPFKPISVNAQQECVMLRYPVRIANKKECLHLAAQKRFEIGSWFDAPLHPGGPIMGALGYLDGMCPESEKASREVINLPTHSKITIREVERIIEFLCRYAQPA